NFIFSPVVKENPLELAVSGGGSSAGREQARYILNVSFGGRVPSKSPGECQRTKLVVIDELGFELLSAVHLGKRQLECAFDQAKSVAEVGDQVTLVHAWSVTEGIAVEKYIPSHGASIGGSENEKAET